MDIIIRHSVSRAKFARLYSVENALYLAVALDREGVSKVNYTVCQDAVLTVASDVMTVDVSLNHFTATFIPVAA